MKLTKDITVKCECGDYSLHMGKALTTIYFKGLEKFVIRNTELDMFIEMIQKSRELVNAPEVRA
jgi:hypothetical protein